MLLDIDFHFRCDSEIQESSWIHIGDWLGGSKTRISCWDTVVRLFFSMCNSVFIMHGINEWSIHASSIEIFPKEMEILILYLTLLYPILPYHSSPPSFPPFLLPSLSVLLVYHLQRTLQIWLSKIRKWFARTIGAASCKHVKFDLPAVHLFLTAENQKSPTFAGALLKTILVPLSPTHPYSPTGTMLTRTLKKRTLIADLYLHMRQLKQQYLECKWREIKRPWKKGSFIISKLQWRHNCLLCWVR